MFENNSDEDFDFDLDEVVKLNSQPVYTQNVDKEVRISTENSKKEIHHIQQQTQNVENWPNEDDSHLFESLLEPAADIKSVTITQSNIRASTSVQPNKGKDLRNNSINIQQSLNPLHFNDVSVNKSMDTVKAKFPGPAGSLNLPSNNNVRGQRPKMNKNLTNVDGLCWWDTTLSLLNVKRAWQSNEMNLQMIKKTFAPHVIYLTAPILIVGVQKVEFAPIITSDVNCVLQDPTGEVNGRILKDVIADYGKLIQVGTILVLRRPSALHMDSNCIVTITKNCLVGVFSSQSNEITRCRDFEKGDLISWLSEPMVTGDPVLCGEETSEEETTKPPVSLFTSAGSALASTSGARSAIQSPASLHRPMTPSNYNRPRPPANTTPSIRPSTAGPSRPSPGQIRPLNNPNQYQFKTPSTVVTTPRPAPYAQPNRTSSNVDSIPIRPAVAANKEPGVDDQFLSQFLDGIDTDSLFDDF